MTGRLIEWAMAGSLLLAGAIHLIPGAAMFSAERVQSLYAIRLGDPTLILLLRHRALLFGLLGIALLGAAFVPNWRVLASLAALLSMVGFVVFAGTGPHPAAILRVIQIDIGLSLILGATLAAKLFLIATRP